MKGLKCKTWATKTDLFTIMIEMESILLKRLSLLPFQTTEHMLITLKTGINITKSLRLMNEW